MANAFSFTDYDSDFINQFLKEHGDKLTPEVTQSLADYAVTQQNRDYDLEDYLSYQSFVPSIGLTLSAAQAANPSVKVVFASIEFQSTTVLSWVNTAPTRITLLSKGIVSIVGNTTWDAGATGNYRTAQIFINGSNVVGCIQPPIGGGGTPQCSVSVIKSLSAGDYIELFANQDTGGSLNVQGALAVAYLGQSSS